MYIFYLISYLQDIPNFSKRIRIWCICVYKQDTYIDTNTYIMTVPNGSSRSLNRLKGGVLEMPGFNTSKAAILKGLGRNS